MFLVLKYVQNFMKIYKNPNECIDMRMRQLHASTFPSARKKNLQGTSLVPRPLPSLMSLLGRVKQERAWYIYSRE